MISTIVCFTTVTKQTNYTPISLTERIKAQTELLRTISPTSSHRNTAQNYKHNLT